MTTTSTASPPTSDLRFLDRNGFEIAVPPEWTSAHLSLPFASGDLDDVRVEVNGRVAEVLIRRLGTEARLVALWERAGPGWYDIAVRVGPHRLDRRIQVLPSKISQLAFGRMLKDLELRLPVTIAVALRDHGARLGVEMAHVAPQTLETEIARLRRAIYGSQRPGLLAVLRALASDPHRMLIKTGEWVRRERARRPDPGQLVRALWRAGNASEGRLEHVVDLRVEHTVDLYENRILRSFVLEVEQHLRRLRGVLVHTSHDDLEAEVVRMLDELLVARRSAAFIDDVSDLSSAPDHVTMVLLKRREYRAAYEGMLEFRRRMAVHLDEPILAEPLANLPLLYQHWGTLLVIDALIEAAGRAGFTVAYQRLVWPHQAGAYVRVLEDGKCALEMKNEHGDELRLHPERSYGRIGSPLGSVSFSQRPDVAVELARSDGTREVYLFDPKYKLSSEEDAEPGDGKPKKVDVDKMHAYRDAIRDRDGRHVVRYAATLYPGETATYDDGLAALRMYPGEEGRLRGRLLGILGEWLGRE